MTQPLEFAREKIILAMLKAQQPFGSQKAIALAAGLITPPVPRNGAKLRLAQRAVTRLVKAGVIHKEISPSKVDNRYTLSLVGRTVAATLHSDAVSPKRRADQPHAEATR